MNRENYELYRDSYRYSNQHPVEGCKKYKRTEKVGKEYYDERSSEYKASQPEFNGWGSKFSQVIRFDVIIEEMRKDIVFNRPYITTHEFKVLDFGCGSGELKNYLPREFSYLGIDIREDIEGIDIYGGVDIFDENFEQFLSDNAFKPDYCVASGSLAFMEVPEVERVIARLLELAKNGVVFNLLDAKSDYMGDERVVHVQRKRFFSYIFNNYRVEKKYEVRMRTDYFPDEDFTIGIFK